MPPFCLPQMDSLSLCTETLSCEVGSAVWNFGEGRVNEKFLMHLWLSGAGRRTSFLRHSKKHSKKCHILFCPVWLNHSGSSSIWPHTFITRTACPHENHQPWRTYPRTSADFWHGHPGGDISIYMYLEPYPKRVDLVCLSSSSPAS